MTDRNLKSTLDRIARGIEKLGLHFPNSTEEERRVFLTGDPFWQSYLAAADRAKRADIAEREGREEVRKRLKDAGWKQWEPTYNGPKRMTICPHCNSHWLDPITNGRFSFDDAARLQAERSGG